MIYDKIISQYGFDSFLIATLVEYLLKQISSLTVIQLYILCLPRACFLCVYIADNIGNEILKWKKYLASLLHIGSIMKNFLLKIK